jgi:DNA-binding HxlR family transcriptional regulator
LPPDARGQARPGKVSATHTGHAGGDWWTPLIIRDLQLGIDRFDALAQNLGISRNLLTTRLAHLVEHGIVERRRYQQQPPRDRYVLTGAGHG